MNFTSAILAILILAVTACSGGSSKKGSSSSESGSTASTSGTPAKNQGAAGSGTTGETATTEAGASASGDNISVYVRNSAVDAEAFSINIAPLRDPIDVGERAVVLNDGPSGEVAVTNAGESVSCRSNIDAAISAEGLDEETLDNQHLVVIVSYEEGDTTTSQLISYANMVIDKAHKTITVKIRACNFKYSLGIVSDPSKLTYGDHHIPFPYDPEGVQCSALSHSKTSISWVYPGGNIGAYKVVQSNDQAAIEADAGCQLPGTSVEGTKSSIVFESLAPATTYYARVCSMSNTSDLATITSVGKVCSATTEAASTTVVHALWIDNSNSGTYSGNLRHAVKTGTNAWQINSIASGLVLEHASFTLDKADRPLVAFYKADGNYLGKLVNGSWQFDKFVEPSGLTASDGMAVVVRADNYPSIIYTPTFYYGEGAGDTTAHVVESRQTLAGLESFIASQGASTTWGGQNGEMAATLSDGRIVVAFREDADNQIYFLQQTNVNGTWGGSPTKISNSTNCVSAMRPAVTVDDQDKLHITYMCNTQASKCATAYTTNVSGSWVEVFVDTDTNTSCSTGRIPQPELALDSNNKAWITYLNKGDPGQSLYKTLRVATNTGGSWVASSVGTSTSGFDGARIAVDIFDMPHIIVNDQVDFKMVHYYQQAGVWQTREEIFQSNGNSLQAMGLIIESVPERTGPRY